MDTPTARTSPKASSPATRSARHVPWSLVRLKRSVTRKSGSVRAAHTYAPRNVNTMTAVGVALPVRGNIRTPKNVQNATIRA